MVTTADFVKPIKTGTNSSNNTNTSDFKEPKKTSKDDNTQRGFIKKYNENQNYLSQTASNIIPSVKQLGVDVAQPFIHPVQTAKSLYELGGSLISLIPGVKGDETLAKTVGQHFADRYGGLENVKKTFATDPAGLLSDLSIIFTGGAMIAPKASAAANILTKASKIDPINLGISGSKLAYTGAKKTLENVPSAILGTTTGAGKLAIETAFNSGQKGGKVAEDFRNNITGRESLSKVVEDTLDSLKTKKAETSKTYVKGKGELNLGSQKVNPESISYIIDDIVSKKTLGNFELSSTAQKKLKELDKIVKEWRLNPKAHTLEGLDALKRRIDAEYPPGLKVGDSGKLVSDVRNQVKDIIVKKAPEYAKVMKAYEEAIKLEQQLMGELSLSKRADVGTTLRKLQSIMRNNVNTNFGNRLEALKLLDTADGNLIAKLAGQSLNTLGPRGFANLIPSASILAGTVASGAGMNPLAVLPSLIAGSPRLMGELSYGAGVATKPISLASKKVNELSKKIPAPVKNILKPNNLFKGSRVLGLLDSVNQNQQELQNRGLLQ